MIPGNKSINEDLPIIIVLPEKAANHRRFTSTIGTHKSHTITGLEIQVQSTKDLCTPEGFFDVFELNQLRIPIL